VQHILNEDGRSNPFPNNRPGYSWYRLFMKRHPRLGERCAEPITRSRAALTEGCVRGWFKDARSFFHDEKIEYVLNNPERRYNGSKRASDLIQRLVKFLDQRETQFTQEAGGNKEQLSLYLKQQEQTVR